MPINSRPDHAQMTPSTYTNKHQPGTTRMSHNLKAQCPQPKSALYCRIQTDRQPSPPQDSNSMDDSTPFSTVWGPPPCRAPEKSMGYRESLWWETQRHCHWWSRTDPTGHPNGFTNCVQVHWVVQSSGLCCILTCDVFLFTTFTNKVLIKFSIKKVIKEVKMTFDPLVNWFNEDVLGSVVAANVLVLRMS